LCDALADETTKELAVDILNDLDWCLDQLESMQTHRSVSNMTTNKVSIDPSVHTHKAAVIIKYSTGQQKIYKIKLKNKSSNKSSTLYKQIIQSMNELALWKVTMDISN